jgi:hypothetical protein
MPRTPQRTAKKSCKNLASQRPWQATETGNLQIYRRWAALNDYGQMYKIAGAP